jgi:hypothetical protein
VRGALDRRARPTHPARRRALLRGRLHGRRPGAPRDRRVLPQGRGHGRGVLQGKRFSLPFFLLPVFFRFACFSFFVSNVAHSAPCFAFPFPRVKNKQTNDR